jgi:hypothetical protein
LFLPHLKIHFEKAHKLHHSIILTWPLVFLTVGVLRSLPQCSFILSFLHLCESNLSHSYIYVNALYMLIRDTDLQFLFIVSLSVLGIRGTLRREGKGREGNAVRRQHSKVNCLTLLGEVLTKQSWSWRTTQLLAAENISDHLTWASNLTLPHNSN